MITVLALWFAECAMGLTNEESALVSTAFAAKVSTALFGRSGHDQDDKGAEVERYFCPQCSFAPNTGMYSCCARGGSWYHQCRPNYVEETLELPYTFEQGKVVCERDYQ